jgi:stage V sporulation protein AE
MEYARAFIVGGIICVIGQILIDKTKLTSARILVFFVVAGCLLSALGIYGPVAEYAGAGATVPLPGFGHTLAEGVKKEVDEIGFMGIFTGGLKATAGGIAAATVFSFLASLVFEPKER